MGKKYKKIEIFKGIFKTFMGMPYFDIFEIFTFEDFSNHNNRKFD